MRVVVELVDVHRLHGALPGLENGSSALRITVTPPAEAAACDPILCRRLPDADKILAGVYRQLCPQPCPHTSMGGTPLCLDVLCVTLTLTLR